MRYVKEEQKIQNQTINNMNENNINYDEYSMDQLLDSLENVDDVKYPDNALKIYKLILKKLNLDYQKVSAESLGYKNVNPIISWLLTFIPFVTLIEMDQENLNNQMHDKIIRLNSMLDFSSKN